MRVVGVRLGDGRLVWVDAADRTVARLDAVEVRLGQSVSAGTIVVTPDQLIGDITSVGAVITGDSHPAERTGLCNELPGADMPPLGAALSTGSGDGTVVRLDAVNRTVVVAGADGFEVTLPWPPSGDDSGKLTIRGSEGSAPAPRL